MAHDSDLQGGRDMMYGAKGFGLSDSWGLVSWFLVPGFGWGFAFEIFNLDSLLGVLGQPEIHKSFHPAFIWG